MALRPTFKETTLNMRKPDQEFSVLQNVRFELRDTDGDFADVQSVAINKRYGTDKFGNEISASGELHTLLSYINNTNDYLIAGHGTNLYKFVESTLANPVAVTDVVIDLVDGTDFATSGSIFIGDNEIFYTGKAANQLTGVTGIAEAAVATTRVIQRIWKSIKSGLTSGLYFTGAVMDSYSGTAAVTGTMTPAHTGTWTSIVYDSVTGYTTLTDNTKAWVADNLIGRLVKPNTGDYPELEYEIVENGTTYIRVEGDIKGVNTTTVDDIACTTVVTTPVVAGAATVTLTDTSDFRTSGGTASLEGDLFTYTGKSATQLTGCTGIDIGHAVGSVCASAEVALTTTVGLPTNGWVKINTYDCYYNGLSGKKLLNLANIEVAIASGSAVTNSNNKTWTGKSYSIEFSTVSTRIVDTSASWTTDAYVGYIVHIYDGLGAGQQRVITSNKKDYLEVAFSWEEEPDGTSKYKLYADSDKVLYMGNGTDSLQRYDGSSVTAISTAPKGNITMVYQSRLFIAADYTVSYSDVGDPEYFSPIFTITPLGDDKITGLAEWNGNGIIFKERSIWKFNFSFNDTTSMWDIDIVQIPSNSGCVSHRTIQKVENVLWYFDGTAIKYLGASPNQIGVIRTEDISFPIYQSLSQISVDMRLKTVAVYDDENYLMFGARYSTDTTNTIGYDYDSSFTGWSTRTGNNAASVIFHKGIRYYGDASSGQVYQMDIEDSYLDDSTPVDMIVATKDTDLKNPAVFKTFRFGVYEFENEDTSVEYNAKVYTTKNTLTREGNWDIGTGLGGGALLGEALIGGGAMGGASEAPRRVVKKESLGFSGTRIQHILRNRKDENLSITSISTIWYLRSMRHFPSSQIT